MVLESGYPKAIRDLQSRSQIKGILNPNYLKSEITNVGQRGNRPLAEAKRNGILNPNHIKSDITNVGQRGANL